MRSALATSSATLALASKVWGSVLGLFKIDETDTYFPPIWLKTLAYSFSAPMATMTWDELAPEGCAASEATIRVSTTTPAASEVFANERVVMASA